MRIGIKTGLGVSVRPEGRSGLQLSKPVTVLNVVAPAIVSPGSSYITVSRPGILPKPIGLGAGGSISLGFERHHGFYELVCSRFSPPGAAAEFVSRDSGYVDAGRRSASPPARKERKIALIIFFLKLEEAKPKAAQGLVEIGRGGANSWCHSLYRLSVHNPKDGVGNKWLGAALGLEDKYLDDPFSGVLRFIQCRRAGTEFLVHLDCAAFDPSSVVASAWGKGEWDPSPKLRLEILYDLMRQVPRWAPLEAKTFAPVPEARRNEAQAPAPWEDMPIFLRCFEAATRVRMVGLNHQVFRRVRSTWLQERHGAAPFEYRNLNVISAAESAAEREKRIAREVADWIAHEPLSEALEEFTVFIGSADAHDAWERDTQWRPEVQASSLAFWRAYLTKVARLRPRARVRLFVVDNVSPLALHLEFPDGSSFLKWAPAMFGAYHPGNPGWNLFWNLGAPPPPHFKEIVEAMEELEKRASGHALGPAPVVKSVCRRTRVSNPA